MIRTLLWASMVVAVAAYGSVVVRNITEAMVGIASPGMVVAERPNR